MAEKRLKVLLIEDLPGDARLIQETLKQGDRGFFDVEWVERLERAFQRLSQGGIDVVLSDLNVPDGRGADLIRQLHERHPELPVVVLTGTYLDEAVALECIQAGAQDYLIKDDLFKGVPLPTFIRRVLRYAIERQRASGELKRAKKELEEKVAELELLNKSMLGREERILELKEENLRLREQLETQKTQGR
jgi:DNA-binding NtrC family response regulator